jgi:hypothetical protein
VPEVPKPGGADVSTAATKQPAFVLTSRGLGLLAWFALALLVAITLLQGPIANSVNLASAGLSVALVVSIVRLVLLAFIYLALVVLVTRAIASVPSPAPPAARPPGEPAAERSSAAKRAFPESPTVAVGAWLTFATMALAFGLLESLAPQLYLPERFQAWSCVTGDERCADGRNLMVTMFAAGSGAMVTTILAYLEHASTKKDFDRAFVPWYVARPAIGMLLGIVVYFLVKGGLLVTVGEVNSARLNVFGLAGIAALCGLFSKQAVEKLREVFDTLFRTAAKEKKDAAKDV